MAGTKPMRPRPPPISPQAHESHEVPSTKRSKPSPVTAQPTPTVTLSPDELNSMYATVKKPKRYPPPSVPAPPPPYEGDDVDDLISVEPLTSPTPPAMTKEPSEMLTKMRESHPPDGDRTQETSGSGFDAGAGGSGSKQRPPRPAPSRPARPPAGIKLMKLMKIYFCLIIISVH